MRKPSRYATSYLFTVRLWFEDLGEGRNEWRGEVKDIASGHQQYFRDWDALVSFFQLACIASQPGLIEPESD